MTYDMSDVRKTLKRLLFGESGMEVLLKESVEPYHQKEGMDQSRDKGS